MASAEEDYVYADTSEEKMKVCESEKGGKWLLFFNQFKRKRDAVNQLEAQWPKFVNLVNDGKLINAKRSKRPSNNFKRNGVIMCYTKDFKDKDDVRAAAMAINSVIESQYDMYYKTNKASSEGLYRYEGHESMTIYKYIFKLKRMYERVEDNAWV